MKVTDFPSDAFPILIEALHPDTRVVVWHRRIEKPAPGVRELLYIPPLARQLGHRVAIRITFGTGEIQEEP